MITADQRYARLHDECASRGLRMTPQREVLLKVLSETMGLSKADAYSFCSVAGDLHVTQAVNGSKGVHMMMPKALVHQKA